MRDRAKAVTLLRQQHSQFHLRAGIAGLQADGFGKK